MSRPAWLPSGMTEAEVLATIEQAVDVLAPSFVAPGHDLDDVKQHGRVAALEALSTGRYDPLRPLGSFLFVAIKRRLLNLRREVMRTDDVGCRGCYRAWLSGADEGCGQATRGCRRFAKWRRNQDSRHRLLQAQSMDDVPIPDGALAVESTVVEDAAAQELRDRIAAELPADLRGPFLRMLAGVPVRVALRDAVREAVRRIVGDAE